jgi:hypothetical protein
MQAGVRYCSFPYTFGTVLKFSFDEANSLMMIVNMVYLSTLTDRVAVLPPFMPMHVGSDAPPVPFGEVFDVPRLSKTLGVPLLEWRDIKDPKSTELETLGCWSVWEAVSGEEPRPSLAPYVLSLGSSQLESIKISSAFKEIPHQ